MRLAFLLNWYNRVLQWSRHPKASYYLGLVSFIDASFFPISPLFMLLPMSFSEPNKSFRYAFIAIIASFFGGILGYALGALAADTVVKTFMEFMGYSPYYQRFAEGFQTWGFWAVLFGCFAPFIPYKIFTIGSGLMKLDFISFLLASLVGRAIRFLLIAAIIYWGGPKTEPWLRKFLTRLSTTPSSEY